MGTRQLKSTQGPPSGPDAQMWALSLPRPPTSSLHRERVSKASSSWRAPGAWPTHPAPTRPASRGRWLCSLPGRSRQAQVRPALPGGTGAQFLLAPQALGSLRHLLLELDQTPRGRPPREPQTAHSVAPPRSQPPSHESSGSSWQIPTCANSLVGTRR